MNLPHERLDRLANRVHGIDSTNARRDHFLGIDTRVRIDRRSIDIQIVLGKHLRTLIDSSTRAIKDTTQHVLRDRNLEILSCELDGCFADINTGSTLEDLDDGPATTHFQHLTSTLGSVGESEVYNLDVVSLAELVRE